MPEIAEIARTVHHLRHHLLNRRIASIQTTADDLVFNSKAATTASSFAAALKGKTVLDARQQGKYFWLVLDSPPHPLFHFGMTGWMRFRGEAVPGTAGASGAEGEESEVEGEKKGKKNRYLQDDPDAEWPPKFWKFVLHMEGEPKCEAAFLDGRRLARIRLVDAAAEEMRNTSPLKENGPDPVIDKDVLTKKWLVEKLKSKKVPVKALLLDQANISGVGNWVADEVLYHAKIHPEQYSNTFSEEQMAQLHESLMYVCDTACGVLADSDKFPKEWLFKHRWDKGKKGEERNVMPSGEKIVHLKVGGRTSAIVPSVQKKTGPVAGDVDGDDGEDGGKKAKGPKRKGKAVEVGEEVGEQKGKSGKRKTKKEVLSDDEELEVEEKKRKAAPEAKKRKTKKEASSDEEVDEESAEEPETKKQKGSATVKANGGAVKTKVEKEITNGASNGRRKSARLSGA